ncbi:MAG: hypothetical protein R3E32_02075 [Chitinophagales bacterium]
MSNIKCKNCGEVIPAENINIQKALAKCTNCNAIFSIEEQVKIPRPAIPMPEKFEILKLRSSLDISYKWYSPIYIFLAFFALFWNGFMAVWYYIALTEGIWMMAIFGVIHLSVGVGLIYTVLAGFFNTTHINVTSARLKILHEPLPWRGSCELEVSEIDQLFCKLQINRGKNGSTSQEYHLYLIDVTGKHTKLLTNLQTPEQALYLEQELEQFLEIEDRKVPGELEF